MLDRVVLALGGCAMAVAALLAVMLAVECYQRGRHRLPFLEDLPETDEFE